MKPTLVTYGALGLAILLEVAATSLLHQSRQFTRIGPTCAMIALYVAAFYLVSIALQALPMGVVYAVWSGLGIVLISLVGLVAFSQRPDPAAIVGMALIVSGVLVVHLFSRSVAG